MKYKDSSPPPSTADKEPIPKDAICHQHLIMGCTLNHDQPQPTHETGRTSSRQVKRSYKTKFGKGK